MKKESNSLIIRTAFVVAASLAAHFLFDAPTWAIFIFALLYYRVLNTPSEILEVKKLLKSNQRKLDALMKHAGIEFIDEEEGEDKK